MSKKITFVSVMSSLWVVAMVGSFALPGATGAAWPERLARCLVLTAICLIPVTAYRINRSMLCPAK